MPAAAAAAAACRHAHRRLLPLGHGLRRPTKAGDTLLPPARGPVGARGVQPLLAAATECALSRGGRPSDSFALEMQDRLKLGSCLPRSRRGGGGGGARSLAPQNRANAESSCLARQELQAGADWRRRRRPRRQRRRRGPSSRRRTATVSAGKAADRLHACMHNSHSRAHVDAGWQSTWP